MPITPEITGRLGCILVNGSLVPDSNVEYDLGSLTNRWRDLYLSGSTIHIGETSITRSEDGSVSILDQNNVVPAAVPIKIQSLASITPGQPIDCSGVTLSNVLVNIHFSDLSTGSTPNVNYTTDTMVLDNSGTSNTLVVNQIGACNTLEVQDEGTTVLQVLDEGRTIIGALALSSNVTIDSETFPRLRVQGVTRINGDMLHNGTRTIIETGVNTSEQILLTNDGSGPALIVNQTGAQPVLDVQDDGASVFYVADGGNVGFGTNAPQQKLHIEGTLLSTDGFVAYSDAKFKTNIEEITNATQLISQLRGVRYNRVDVNAEPSRRIGLIAQEVERVLPEMVSTDENGLKALSYGDLVSVLIQAIKEQQAELDLLERSISQA